MFTSLKKYLFGKLVSIYFKTNGWKTIVGFVVAKLTALLATQFPDIPQEAIIQILNWLAEMILAVGVLDRFRKNLLEAKNQ